MPFVNAGPNDCTLEPISWLEDAEEMQRLAEGRCVRYGVIVDDGNWVALTDGRTFHQTPHAFQGEIIAAMFHASYMGSAECAVIVNFRILWPVTRETVVAALAEMDRVVILAPLSESSNWYEVHGD